MPENLNWNFNLFDGIKGPAVEMAGSLDILAKKLTSLSGTMDAFEKRVAASGKGVKEAGKSAKESAGMFSGITAALGEFGWAMEGAKKIAEPFMAIGGAVFDAAWDFGSKSIEALAFKENTLASFKVLLGSAEEAEKMFSQAAWLGKATPFETKDVVEQYQRLLSAGFTKMEVPIVFQALGDAAAMRGFSPAVMNNIGNALGHIMSNGFNARTEYMLSMDAAGTGFSKERMKKQLAKNLGVDEASIHQMMKDGSITARQGVKAFVDVMAETAGGGITGGGMKAQQNTLSGIMSTLHSTFSDFFLTLEGTADKVKGFGVLKSALINIRSALDTTTVAGRKLQMAVVEAFSTMAESILGPLSGPDGLKSMETLVTRMANAMQTVGAVGSGLFQGMWAAAEGFMDVLGGMDEDFRRLFEGPMTPEKIEAIKKAMVDFGHEAGESLGLLAKDAKDLFSAMHSGLAFVRDLNKVMTLNPDGSVSFDPEAAERVLMGTSGDPVKVKKDTAKALDDSLHEAAELIRTGGRGTMTKQPGGGAHQAPSFYPPFSLTINAAPGTDVWAVEAAAKKGVQSALDHHNAMRKLATQAGAH